MLKLWFLTFFVSLNITRYSKKCIKRFLLIYSILCQFLLNKMGKEGIGQKSGKVWRVTYWVGQKGEIHQWLVFECHQVIKCQICITGIGFINTQGRCWQYNPWRWQLVQNMLIVLMYANLLLEYLKKSSNI